MLAADYAGPGHPLPGSADWAAVRIQRLLEQDEEHRRRMAWADEARHPVRPPRPAASPLNEHTLGSDAWGAQEMGRLLEAGADGAELHAGQPFAWSNIGGQRRLVPVGVSRGLQYRGEIVTIPRGDTLLTNEEAAELGFSMLPVVGDAYGLANDIETYIDDPESRTWTNFGLTAASMLPFVPGGMTKFVRKGGEKLEDILNANPRAKVEDIAVDATGRLGRPITRETVIRVANEFQRRFDGIEPERYKLIAGGGLKERAIQPTGYDGLPGRGLAQGANFGDIVFLDTKTGKQFIIQVARLDAQGRPIAEELDAALKIARTPTRIPNPYRNVEELMELPVQRQHTVIVVAPPSE